MREKRPFTHIWYCCYAKHPAKRLPPSCPFLFPTWSAIMHITGYTGRSAAHWPLTLGCFLGWDELIVMEWYSIRENTAFGMSDALNTLKSSHPAVIKKRVQLIGCFCSTEHLGSPAWWYDRPEKMPEPCLASSIPEVPAGGSRIFLFSLWAEARNYDNHSGEKLSALTDRLIVWLR